MNLKKVLGAFTALSIIAGAMPVFAADSDFISFETPYDITTGEYTTDLTKGHKIAVPVNIDSTTDYLTSYGFEATYDNSLLKPGADANNSISDDEWNNLDVLSGYQVYYMADSLVGIDSLGQKRGSNFNTKGTLIINPEKDVDRVAVAWYTDNSNGVVSINKETPELYLVFDVIEDCTALNSDVFKLDQSTCLLSDTVNGKDEVIDIPGSVTKANACDGAFKIVVDSEQLPYWVQGVTAVIKDNEYALDACVNTDGTTEYSFPVRVTSAADEASVDVEIKATVSNDENGAEDSREVEWGKVTVDMSGTATDYADTSVNY